MVEDSHVSCSRERGMDRTRTPRTDALADDLGGVKHHAAPWMVSRTSGEVTHAMVRVVADVRSVGELMGRDATHHSANRELECSPIAPVSREGMYDVQSAQMTWWRR